MKQETRQWLEQQKAYWDSQLEQIEYKRDKGMSQLKRQVKIVRDARKTAASCKAILEDINSMLVRGDWEV